MTLAEKAYFAIRADIVSGSLPPAQPLRLDALKKRYGIGFSPLREALNRLQVERLVSAAPLRGFAVAPLSLPEMWDAIETRIVIETDALRRSIRHGDDDWETQVVSKLHALTLQANRFATSGITPVQAEAAALEKRHHGFHRALISACRSNWMLDFTEKLYVETERYRYPALMDRSGGGGRNVQAEHTELARAATDRDADLAAGLLTQHLRQTGEDLHQNFESYFPLSA